MIFEKVLGNINKIDNLEKYKIEYINIPYEYLNKDLFKVVSSQNNEYGISINHNENPLKNGDILYKDDNKIIVINVKPEKMIIITPKNIDEMGFVAHLLGNTHKPIIVENGQIILENDSTVENILKKYNVEYKIDSISLNKPLNYVNLSQHHHE